LVGKNGREQLFAMLWIAGIFWFLSRLLNQFLDGNPHFEAPFEVIYKNRKYGMRSVPEDIWRAFKDTRRFVYGRISPIIGRGTVELLTGKNYRGEAVSAGETFRDLLVAWMPIVLRNLPGVEKLSPNQVNRTVDAWESFMGTIGLQISRHSAIQQAYKLGAKYMESTETKVDRGTYPISKYQQLRYALEDGDTEKAAAEKAKLRADGMTNAKIASGFKESLYHPWTQSRDMDRKFIRSLGLAETALVREAERKRDEIWKRFERLH
jgi:hypothetical protein